MVVLCVFALCSGYGDGIVPVQAAEMSSANAAHNGDVLTSLERRSLAQNFVKRMKSGFARANKFSNSLQGVKKKKKVNIYPDGSVLLFQPVLPGFLKPEGVITGRMEQGELMISLSDFATILELPIGINAEDKVANGWYLREDLTFQLNTAEGYVETASGRFDLPSSILFEEQDVFVPLKGLTQWMEFEFDVVFDVQELKITPPHPFPFQERVARRKRKLSTRKTPQAILPLGSDSYGVAGIPFVDVSTDSRYTKRQNGGDADLRHRANIRTSGDFLRGTLTTQSQIDNDEQLRSARANYRQESLEDNLLGPIKARRFEVGDVTQTNILLSRSVGQELGARVTNADPLRNFTSPQTTISGNAIPGWDVELYREAQLVGFKTVDDNGFYSFINVDLFINDNNFRLVFYGPQGEVREEELFVPVDANRLAEKRGVYDVSVTLNDKNTYNKDVGSIDDVDEGSLNVAAIYEQPLGRGAVASASFTSNQQDKERNNVVHGGLSTTVLNTLVNLDTAIDDEADTAAQLTLRRDIGIHELRNTLSWRAEGFDEIDSQANDRGVYTNNFNALGPLPFGFGNNPRYNFNMRYTGTTEGENSIQTTLGANTIWKGFNLGNAYTYSTGSDLEDDRLANISSITGRYGRSRLRLLAENELRPDRQLRRLVANYNHRFSRKLELDLGATRDLDPSLSEFTAQLNWQANFALISPSVRYNTNDDFFAGLSTRFGIGYDPLAGKIRSTNIPITGNGGISALVFLDSNGDGIMGEDEEPLSDVIVHALQNGGRLSTDSKGVAFFTNLQELRLTDVQIDDQTLEDPQWISGFKGVSVLPREGYVAEILFPVHLSGEMDGTLYVEAEGREKRGMRNTRIHLYNAQGKIEQTAVTDVGGFYLFTRIPPGRYLLMVDQNDAQTNKFERPKPQQIEVGYEGAIIYGNDIIAKGDAKDVPSTILADLKDYKALHPHVDFSKSDYDLVMNLGEYNSKIMTSVVWYRLRKRYRSILGDAELMVPAKASVPDNKNGKHALRVGLPNSSLDDAYARCRALVIRNLQCKVEIFPAFMEREFAKNESVKVQ